MRKTIIVLANKYPNTYEPNVNVFTQQLVWGFADKDYQCIVICPVAINYRLTNIKFPYIRKEMTENGREVEIYHPKYIGLGQNVEIFLKTRVSITTWLYIRAVERVLKHFEDISNTVIFGEFLCPSGVASAILGKIHNVPSFFQCGEAMWFGDIQYGNQRLRNKLLKDITGVIALSDQNKSFLVDSGAVDEEKVIIIPSGYRKERIYKIDRNIAREKLNLPKDMFIVGFCGSYDDRKGVLRLEKAIDEIEDKDVCFAAVGKGSLIPTSKKCVLKGPINHNRLALFYSSIDVFAFPTYNEGCCTAIVEAIACGCPIISSDRPFNYEICDETNSILIEPDDIEEMKKAILMLKNMPDLRQKLSEGSLQKGEGLTLDKKVDKLIGYFNI